MGTEIGGMRARPLIIAGLIGLFLYWIVQSPVGAAQTISDLAAATGDFVAMLATRVVQFLDALL